MEEWNLNRSKNGFFSVDGDEMKCNAEGEIFMEICVFFILLLSQLCDARTPTTSTPLNVPVTIFGQRHTGQVTQKGLPNHCPVAFCDFAWTCQLLFAAYRVLLIFNRTDNRLYR